MSAPPAIEPIIRPRVTGELLRLLDRGIVEILVEGPAGTGKTFGLAEFYFLLASHHPKLHMLLARQTRTSLSESAMVTIERDILPRYGARLHDSTASRSQRHSYRFRNGSEIVLGGLDEAEKLYGTEWDSVWVDEAIETTEDTWERFYRARCAGRLKVQQLIASTNPGAPGHWLNVRAMSGKMHRLLTRHADNPSLTPEYLAGLASMTGSRRSRLYEGRWVAAEGGVYPEFIEDRHVLPAFDVPADWPKFFGVDPGYDHPTAILWFCVAPNGRIYVIDEICERQRSVQQHAESVRKLEAARGYVCDRRFADPQHAFSSTAQSPRTIAQQWMDCGFSLVPWPRTAGNEETMVEAVRSLLTRNLTDGDPALQVFDRCRRTISGFQTWAYKRSAQGDIPAGEDKFEDRDNDEMDVVKGVVASRALVFEAGKVEVF